MEKFYSKCGEYIKHSLMAIERPGKPDAWIVQFDYENGWATFDGETWRFLINKDV
jgi:hypothetical protein